MFCSTPNNWQLSFDNKVIPASVPGDITLDLHRAGLVPNPYIAENYKECTWIAEKNFVYSSTIVLSEKDCDEETISLVFKGIDLFATIYFNGKELGTTKNAFLEYKYDVKEIAHPGENTIEVHMESTIKKMESFELLDYRWIFNGPRIFLRKPQCHFGWDWAPKICAYGIIGDVFVEGKPRHQISDVNVVADCHGNLVVHTLLNYDNKKLDGLNGTIADPGEKPLDDKIIVRVSSKPFGDEFVSKTTQMMGKKNFCCFRFENPELWWPSGYGDQPLYNFVVELYRDGELKDTKKGRFAFRSVSLSEKPVGDNQIGFEFLINDKPVFCKGSNWVPPECFTGATPKEKCVEEIRLAKEANMNILRVWGGGSYESDVFYDTCDELGVMVWQDFMLSCSDIPEETPEFVENFLEEAEYQIKRLRNHPSIIFWNAQNEREGSFGNCTHKGDRFAQITLAGLVAHFDGTRPYKDNTPFSYTDIPGDTRSGDSHYSNQEIALVSGTDIYRDYVAAKTVCFVSESAMQGPSSEETLRKIFPSEKLWPMNEMWDDRFMDNPYCGLKITFAKRQVKYAEDIYGPVNGLSDYVQKAMMAHAEVLKMECEFVRGHHEITSGFMNWMYNDIWPSGTWAVLDYYLEPKQAYYQLKRSFAPILGSFYYASDKRIHFYFDNQSFVPYSGKIIYGVKRFDGSPVFEEDVVMDEVVGKGCDIVVPVDKYDQTMYYYARYQAGEEIRTTLYSPFMFGGASFESKFKYTVISQNEHSVVLKIEADSFVKSLYLHFPDNYRYRFSDNFLDLEKGGAQIITITSNEKIDLSALMFDAYRS